MPRKIRRGGFKNQTQNDFLDKIPTDIIRKIIREFAEKEKIKMPAEKPENSFRRDFDKHYEDILKQMNKKPKILKVILGENKEELLELGSKLNYIIENSRGQSGGGTKLRRDNDVVDTQIPPPAPDASPSGVGEPEEGWGGVPDCTRNEYDKELECYIDINGRCLDSDTVVQIPLIRPGVDETVREGYKKKCWNKKFLCEWIRRRWHRQPPNAPPIWPHDYYGEKLTPDWINEVCQFRDSNGEMVNLPDWTVLDGGPPVANQRRLTAYRYLGQIFALFATMRWYLDDYIHRYIDNNYNIWYNPLTWRNRDQLVHRANFMLLAMSSLTIFVEAYILDEHNRADIRARMLWHQQRVDIEEEIERQLHSSQELVPYKTQSNSNTSSNNSNFDFDAQAQAAHAHAAAAAAARAAAPPVDGGNRRRTKRKKRKRRKGRKRRTRRFPRGGYGQDDFQEHDIGKLKWKESYTNWDTGEQEERDREARVFITGVTHQSVGFLYPVPEDGGEEGGITVVVIQFNNVIRWEKTGRAQQDIIERLTTAGKNKLVKIKKKISKQRRKTRSTKKNKKRQKKKEKKRKKKSKKKK